MIPASVFIAGLLGLALTVYLIVANGTAEVAHAMLLIGWWLVPITLFHLVPLLLSALSWRELLSIAGRLDPIAIVCFRWIRESINALLPVASVGGDVASVRLAHLQGVPAEKAAASTVVDVTVGATTQLIFVASGAGLLLARSSDRDALLVAWTVLAGIGVFVVAVAAFVVLQHRGLFGGFSKAVRRLMPGGRFSAFAGSASAIDAAVVEVYRCGPIMVRASLIRLLAWGAGAGEVWLVLHSLGLPLGMVDAYILESLSVGVRAAAFMIPGALGALEASFLLFGTLFGVPPETALAISLSKRVRELALGVPGLLAWHGIETHHFLRRRLRKAP